MNLLINVDADDFENACYVNATSTPCSETDTESNVQKYLYVFMLANALHGAGSTPMFTLGTTYIDNNTKAKNTSLYLGSIRCNSLVKVHCNIIEYTNTCIVVPSDVGIFCCIFRTDICSSLCGHCGGVHAWCSDVVYLHRF